MAGLEDGMAIGQKIQQERESAQTSLFGTDEVVRSRGNGKHALPELPEWDEKTLLAFEKESLGFFITGHPLQRHAGIMKRFSTCSLEQLSEQPDKCEVRVCGIVSALKETLTKKGDRMGFITLEDLTGSIEIVVFPEVYAQSVEYLKGEEPLLVTGTVDVGEKSVKIMAGQVSPLMAVAERETRQVYIRLKAREATRERLEDLKAVLSRHQGGCQTFLHLQITDRSTTVIRLPEDFAVTPTEHLVGDTQKLFGYNPVVFD
jgi:DNA polymerase-3 subunit alpha